MRSIFFCTHRFERFHTVSAKRRPPIFTSKFAPNRPIAGRRSSFDYLVGAQEDRLWDHESNYLCGLHMDCGAPASPSEFAAGLICLHVRRAQFLLELVLGQDIDHVKRFRVIDDAGDIAVPPMHGDHSLENSCHATDPGKSNRKSIKGYDATAVKTQAQRPHITRSRTRSPDATRQACSHQTAFATGVLKLKIATITSTAPTNCIEVKYWSRTNAARTMVETGSKFM